MKTRKATKKGTPITQRRRILRAIDLLSKTSKCYRINGEQYTYASYPIICQTYGEECRSTISIATVKIRVDELEKAGHIKIRRTPEMSNQYCITESGMKFMNARWRLQPAYSEPENTNIQDEFCDACEISPETSRENEANSDDTGTFMGDCSDQKSALPLLFYNKSYKSKNEKNFPDGEEDASIVHDHVPTTRSCPHTPVMAKVLHNHAVEALGEEKAGHLNIKKAQYLRALLIKLGGSMERFIAFLKEVTSRKWLCSQAWFCLDWLLKFSNVEKILSGKLKDFVNKKKEEKIEYKKLNISPEEKKFDGIITGVLKGTIVFESDMNLGRKEKKRFISYLDHQDRQGSIKGIIKKIKMIMGVTDDRSYLKSNSHYK